MAGRQTYYYYTAVATRDNVCTATSLHVVVLSYESPATLLL
jgi:hypothetical protein